MAKKKNVRPSGNGGHQRIVRANVQRELATSPTFVSLYTNDTQLQSSPWDFRFIFGEIARPATEKHRTALINQLGEVRMSPQHAKRVAKILDEQLEGYEKRFGLIPQPTD